MFDLKDVKEIKISDKDVDHIDSKGITIWKKYKPLSGTVYFYRMENGKNYRLQMGTIKSTSTSTSSKKAYTLSSTTLSKTTRMYSSDGLVAIASQIGEAHFCTKSSSSSATRSLYKVTSFENDIREYNLQGSGTITVYGVVVDSGAGTGYYGDGDDPYIRFTVNDGKITSTSTNILTTSRTTSKTIWMNVSKVVAVSSS